MMREYFFVLVWAVLALACFAAALFSERCSWLNMNWKDLSRYRKHQLSEKDLETYRAFGRHCRKTYLRMGLVYTLGAIATYLLGTSRSVLISSLLAFMIVSVAWLVYAPRIEKFRRKPDK
ncbi:MAG: hypothetical protein LBL81_03025 [Tannerella sp.]|nr:hypothetical protein [Tannerella sp.]